MFVYICDIDVLFVCVVALISVFIDCVCVYCCLLFDLCAVLGCWLAFIACV